ARIKAAIVHDVEAASIHRAPEEVATVYGVANILQNRQLSFHEPRVIPVVLMAHHAVGQLAVAHVVVVEYAWPAVQAHIHRDRHTRQPAFQHLGNIGPDEYGAVIARIKGVGVVRVLTKIKQDALARSWPA